MIDTTKEHLKSLVKLARKLSHDELRRFFVDCVFEIPLDEFRVLEANIDNFRADMSERWRVLIEQCGEKTDSEDLRDFQYRKLKKGKEKSAPYEDAETITKYLNQDTFIISPCVEVCA